MLLIDYWLMLYWLSVRNVIHLALSKSHPCFYFVHQHVKVLNYLKPGHYGFTWTRTRCYNEGFQRCIVTLTHSVDEPDWFSLAGWREGCVLVTVHVLSLLRCSVPSTSLLVQLRRWMLMETGGLSFILCDLLFIKIKLCVRRHHLYVLRSGYCSTSSLSCISACPCLSCTLCQANSAHLLLIVLPRKWLGGWEENANNGNIEDVQAN